jgi:ADP-heptose:LPS heptosyltransferase
LRARGALHDKPIFSLHTTAGWKAKEWDMKRYADLLKKIIAEYNMDVAIIGNGTRYYENYNYLCSRGVNVVNALDVPLDTTAGVISNCAFHLGGDSFPMHLAAALGIPALSVAGPTNPAFFMSRNENSIEVVYHQLYCSSPENDLYCTRNPGRSCPTIDCLKGIGVEEVYAAAGKILRNTYARRMS